MLFINQTTTCCLVTVLIYSVVGSKWLTYSEYFWCIASKMLKTRRMTKIA
ncbi:hypothetical protein C3B55_00778 [Candidatus Pseudomonas adelgestsugas]|uniref:Uncharacterized protein n=1 Tax=Candidatus Pseudomonas adelgestsugas TaxID=1302376 RepID=A0ABX5R9J4_9PSED|nr:hypothetical protein C3B55_00778 [Candidatus Pseudomonas adelgestsugas]